MKKLCVLLMIAVALSLFALPADAQFKPESGKIKGYMINEYYYVQNHHVEDYEGRHGFWFRRIYFTYENALGEKVKMRLRFEMNSPGQFSSSTLVPFVKDAYLDFKIGGGAAIRAGIQSPPSFANIEDIWGYRSLEKTPLDLYKWTSSRDFGISLKGGKEFIYQLMFGQGSSNKAEADNGKKIYGMVGYKTGGFHLEVNGHYERRKEVYDEYLIHPFVTYSGDWGRVGVEYAYNDLTAKGQDGAEDTKWKYNVLSFFVVFSASEKVDIIGRYDMTWGDGFKESWKGSGISYVPFADNHEFSFIIGAVSFEIFKNVKLIPNIKYATYKENAPEVSPASYEKPKDNFYTNLTLYFKF
jgi:hypothetical protein